MNLLRVSFMTTLIHISFSQSVCRLQADIVFVVDSSGSINDVDADNWQRVKDFIVSVVTQLDVGPERVRVAAVTFSNLGRLQFGFSNYTTKAEVVAAVQVLEYAGGNTNTSGGLYVMLTEVFTPGGGDRPGVRDVAIVITDGASTRDPHLTAPYATQAKRRGVKIIAVGIGEDIRTEELTQIASPPDAQTQQTVYTVSDFRKLTEILDSIIVETCTVVTTTTQAMTSPTTPTLPTVRECREPVDFVAVVDGSGSVGANNFNRVKDFLQKLAAVLDVDSGRVRVSLATFGSDVTVAFHLNKYDNRQDMITAIAEAKYTHGTTNTAAALRELRLNIVIPGNGAREGVATVAMVITDGSSDSRRDTLDEIRSVKRRGIHVIVVSVGDWLSDEEMDAMATYPFEKNRIHLQDFEMFDQRFADQINDILCNKVDDCTSNPCQNALRCQDHHGYYTCTCIEGHGGDTCADRCRHPADVVFALDCSGSVSPENFAKIVHFARTVISGMRIGTSESARPSHVGLLMFSSEARVVFNLHDFDNKYDILNAFTPTYEGGATNIPEALRVLRDVMLTSGNGAMPIAKRIGVIITDGKSHGERDTWLQARVARDAGIELLAVGIGDQVMDSELEAIATAYGLENGNVLRTSGFNDLPSLRRTLTEAICNNEDDCESSPCIHGDCEDGVHGYSCHCSPEYAGRKCDKRCPRQVDLVIAVDTSGSIRSEHFRDIRGFLRRVVDSLDTAPGGKVRVGAVSWADGPKVHFQLDQVFSKQDLLQALDYIEHTGGRTDTASVLDLIRTEMFSAAQGSRLESEHVVLIVTDGNSNLNADDTLGAAIRLKTSGVRVVTVSVGAHVNRRELGILASPSVRDNMLEVTNFGELNNLHSSVVDSLCDEEDECSSSPCLNQGRCVDGFRRFYCICRTDWAGDRCQYNCRRQLDIGFIVDMSGSTASHHDLAESVAQKVVQNLDTNLGKVRVGLLTYGDKPSVDFHLDTYSDKADYLAAMLFPSHRGRTNTQDALRAARRDLFSELRGDRPGVPDVAILITDGYSNVNQEMTIPEALALKRDDIGLYVIAIGENVDMAEVNGMAGDITGPSGRRVYRVLDSERVRRVADDLAINLCS